MTIDFSNSKDKLADAEMTTDPQRAIALLSEVLYTVIIAIERIQKEMSK